MYINSAYRMENLSAWRDKVTVLLFSDERRQIKFARALDPDSIPLSTGKENKFERLLTIEKDGVNDAFKPFHSAAIARENLSTLSFTQVISKARDFETGLSARRDLKDAAHKVTWRLVKQRLHITLADKSMSGLHALQVPLPVFCARAHHMPSAVTASPQSAFAMAVRNGDIGYKYLHFLSEAAVSPGPDMQKD